MDYAELQSLFVAVSYGRGSPYFSSMFLLERNANKPITVNRRPLNQKAHLTSEGLPKLLVIPKIIETHSLDLQKDFVAHLTTYSPGLRKAIAAHLSHLISDSTVYKPPVYKPPACNWRFCIISAEDLCILPDRGLRSDPFDVPLKGFIFNVRTKNCKQIRSPECCFRCYQDVVALDGHIYCVTDPYSGGFLMRYNPLEDRWENLEPFPDGDGIYGPIFATAVLDDTIILNIDCTLWAYDVKRNKWYQPRMDDHHENSSMLGVILGKPVVLENTLYALTTSSTCLVLALSIQNIDGHIVFSSLSEIIVPGLNEDNIRDRSSLWLSRHLVHLGEDTFCLVQSCQSHHPILWQPIQVTYIKLKKGEKPTMTVTGTVIHKLRITSYHQFNVELCFSLPDHMAAALKECEGTVLKFNPLPESEQKHKKHYVVNVKGGSVYVRNLPRNANVIQVEKELEKFGAIKRDGIQVLKYRKGSYAFVEFEYATSKQRAIQASPIIIGGCSAQILEKRPSKKKKREKR